VAETVEELNLQLHTKPTALNPKTILGNLGIAAQAVHKQEMDWMSLSRLFRVHRQAEN
jgi:hypothetical protein